MENFAEPMKDGETLAEAIIRVAWAAGVGGFDSYQVLCPKCMDPITDKGCGCPEGRRPRRMENPYKHSCKAFKPTCTECAAENAWGSRDAEVAALEARAQKAEEEVKRLREKLRDGSWRLVRDLDGHRLLESQDGNMGIVIVLEPNLERPVSWLLEEMESLADKEPPCE